MAKKRRPIKMEASGSADAKAVRQPKSRPGGKSFLPRPNGRFPLRSYILMNVLFDGFCFFNLLFIRQTLRETRGLYFFFGLLMVGFFLVSLYDYLFDRVVPQNAGDESDEFHYTHS